MRDITPKPTRYSGYTFKSRLEARWAVFLNNHLVTAHTWEYEPYAYTDPDTGWTYTPDFGFYLTGGYILLEVKPTFPTSIQSLRDFTVLLDAPLYLGFGEFYRRKTPMIARVSTESIERKVSPNVRGVHLSKLFDTPNPNSLYRAIKAAKNYRFDLR